jgi:uncharacterized membrane protein
MRGLVMILMMLDHASGHFDAHHLRGGGTFMYKAGTFLPVAPFLTRWVTHLCAPTFVFLAGASVMMSVAKQKARGDSDWAIDRFLASRGLLILALDPLWMSWMFLDEGGWLLQVLYAIGGSFLCMTLPRRLPPRALLGFALFFFVFGELVIGIALKILGHNLAVGLLLSGGMFGDLIVAYPLVPWLSIMMFGAWFGAWLQSSSPMRVVPSLATAGLLALIAFAFARGLNGYGNMQLARDDASLTQWLHVSKYPPSLTFVTLELGIMALFLAFFFRVEQTGASPAWTRPLLVFGQTAFFFYLIHAHLLKLAAKLLGRHHHGTILEGYAAATIGLVLLYPACVAYGKYKRAHPTGWVRYV